MIRKVIGGLGAMGAGLLSATAAFAQEAAAEGPIKAPTVEQMAGMVDKGDTTWMLISSALVLLMSIPALALFYGGLVRTKNMLSLLMQVFMIVSVAALVWATAWPSPAAATACWRRSSAALTRCSCRMSAFRPTLQPSATTFTSRNTPSWCSR
jgi:hypothetical protein